MKPATRIAGIVLPKSSIAALNHQNTKAGFPSHAISFARKPSSADCPIIMNVDSSQSMTAGKKNGNLIANPTAEINARTPSSGPSRTRKLSIPMTLPSFIACTQSHVRYVTNDVAVLTPSISNVSLGICCTKWFLGTRGEIVAGYIPYHELRLIIDCKEEPTEILAEHA